MKQGVLITFEGGEGAGKSTQIARLAAHLRDAGRAVTLTREPGGTSFGEEARRILKHAPYGATLTDEAELLLFLAARAQLVREVIRPALDRGEIVLCDRFTDSTLAYQGAGRGLDDALIRRLNDFATGGLAPDRTYFLDVPTSIGLARAGKRADAADRLETLGEGFHERVRRSFDALAKAEPARIRTLDATRAPETVFAEILADPIFQ